jgi:hypothetical protein
VTASVTLACYDLAITLKKGVQPMFSLFIAPIDGQGNQVKSDYAHIAVILDRTGSMESIIMKEDGRPSKKESRQSWIGSPPTRTTS